MFAAKPQRFETTNVIVSEYSSLNNGTQRGEYEQDVYKTVSETVKLSKSQPFATLCHTDFLTT